MGDYMSGFRLVLARRQTKARLALREKRLFEYSWRSIDIALGKLIVRPIFETLDSVRAKPKSESLPHPSPRRRVRLAPGSRLLRFAEFVFSARDYEEFMSQPILDMQEEYAAALAERRLWKARWVRVRGYYVFFKAAGSYSVFRAIWKLVRS